MRRLCVANAEIVDALAPGAAPADAAAARRDASAALRQRLAGRDRQRRFIHLRAAEHRFERLLQQLANAVAELFLCHGALRIGGTGAPPAERRT
ncbi:hypothetical protein [Burkholderia oklahomensis]|uniref:hypothetical protein n=1 Tax=Burkholderia oklahomensis TaxID=342113 RepID=UPI000F5238C2|nr:hypothetical protein [Burkholderia oklahomensis]MBI0364147.1 hypothetical protein [Burkholderia oklahomensis]